MGIALQERKRKAPAMTAEQAQSFDRGMSLAQATRLIIAKAQRQQAGQHPAECTCTPYADFYTFRRWKAQGRSVRKGARSFALPIFIECDGKTEEPADPQAAGQIKRPRRHVRPWTAHVFCRCQTVETGQQAEPWPYVVAETAD